MKRTVQHMNVGLELPRGPLTGGEEEMEKEKILGIEHKIEEINTLVNKIVNIKYSRQKTSRNSGTP